MTDKFSPLLNCVLKNTGHKSAKSSRLAELPDSRANVYCATDLHFGSSFSLKNLYSFFWKRAISIETDN